MSADDVIKIIAALGVGSTASAAATAVIASRSERGKSRAEAADLLIGAAERVGKMNETQDAEIKQLKTKLELIHLAFLSYLAEEITRAELFDIMKELR